MAIQSFFDSVASVLTGIARRHGMDAKLLEHKLLRNWADIAGQPVASHTRPDHIRFKKLYLVAENSVWVQHLTFLKPELIAKVNAAAGGAAITDVVLRVGGIDQVQSQKEKGTSEDALREVEPRADLLKEAEAHAAAVADPELRARLADVMAHALTRQEARSKR
jgi:hypothetical protein